MCGEKITKVKNNQLATGSPPHVRGKARLQSKEEPKEGITPACAGKRIVKALNGTAIKDHPRMCGEKNLPHRKR